MESPKRFEEIKPRSMRYDVLRQLRNAILDGTFGPGERLNESEIAREMGISRGPVREAIQALEQEGLIQTIHWRGSFVVELDPQAFRELVDVRIVLETHAATLATQHAEESDFNRLGQIIEQMRQAAGNGELEELVDIDLRFHRTICALAGNQLLLQMWEQLAGRLRLAVLLSLQHGFDAVGMMETHPPVLEAMRQRNAELASRWLNHRTWEAGEAIISALRQRGRSLAADMES